MLYQLSWQTEYTDGFRAVVTRISISFYSTLLSYPRELQRVGSCGISRRHGLRFRRDIDVPTTETCMTKRARQEYPSAPLSSRLYFDVYRVLVYFLKYNILNDLLRTVK